MTPFRRIQVPGWAKWLIPAVAVVAGAVATALAVPAEPVPDGPVTVGTSGRWEGTVKKPGTAFGWGDNLVTNRGDRPARLLKVELIPLAGTDADQLRLLGARAFVPNRNCTVAFAPWPDAETGLSDDTTEPLAGFVVAPGTDIWIVVLLEVREPGASHWTGVRLTYEIDGKTYVATSANGLTVCTTGPHCRLPDVARK